MTLDLAHIAGLLGASAPPLPVSGYSIDSRTLEPGDLFFALKGEKLDGNEYIPQALERGACAVVGQSRSAGGTRVPFFAVEDTLAAMRTIAADARRSWAGDVIGVTGSAGKTTTKDTIAHLLGSQFETGKTGGNFNNHVGLPLSILRLPDRARVAVLEMGMNHAGEIRSLAAIARPRIGVVTNAGWAHIENFDSREGIALAKRELVEALPADGVAILNADDERVAAFAAVHRGEVVTFGLSDKAQVRARDIDISVDGTRFRVGTATFSTQLGGRHAILNILAGIAVAGVYGIPAGRLSEPVRSLVPGKMRGERIARGGMVIWNDCYNSNPDAVRGMLDVLRDTPARRRIAVLGEMLELGRWAEALHRDVGYYAAASGVSVLVGIRGAARYTVDAAIEAGLPAVAAYFFEDPTAAGDFLSGFARRGDAILFKGSRGTRVEKALERFLG